MMGSGFGYSMIPFLRYLHGDSGEELEKALQRHAEHFNAHPYLSGLALGAVCRMEEEGRSPEEVRRFKIAVRGPLGSLGDNLVWVGWRPAVTLLALVMALAGVPPLWTAAAFLVLYNLGHLALRIWGFRVGLVRGSQVGDALRILALPRQAGRVAGTGVFLLGALGGLAAGTAMMAGGAGLLWLSLAAGGVALGSWGGPRTWRLTLWGVPGAVALVFLFSWLG